MGEARATISPNIWHHPDVYELENRGVDPDGAIWAAMATVADLPGANVLDIGCGSGYHLPILSRWAATVVGVEPHPPLVARSQERLSGLSDLGVDVRGIEVRQGAAQALPVAAGSIDVAHARWAYFFGPGCEPGLAELDRVMAPGGTAFVIDNDATRSTFGRWFRRAWPDYDSAAVTRFWTRMGWTRTPVDMRWQFESRRDFEAVVGIEFAPDVAATILAEHDGLGVDYAVNLYHRTYAAPRTVGPGTVGSGT
ncbi:MAG: class I SAM-dependent methyltransferase [Ornithinimicrobium sp.]